MKSNFLYHFALIIIFSFQNLESQNTSVYVAAHPDDWQLFMNPNAYNSLKTPNEKVVFLHTTAGSQNTANNRYLAREEGSLRAIRFMSNTFRNESVLGTNMNKAIVSINGHRILKFTYRNSVAYFLRLSEAGKLGNLYNNPNSKITAIDNSTTYNSLSDLKTTIRRIIESESQGSSNINFNLADTDNTINPNDHPDHISTSKIMQDVAKNMGRVTMNLYTEYNTEVRAQNVFNRNYMISIGTWAVTTSGISDKFHPSTWNDAHNAWIGKQYFRTIPAKPVPGTNIALNKPTTALKNEIGHPSSSAVDNNTSLNSWWGANPYPQMWQVDLGNNYNLNQIIMINYYDGSRYYRYNIEASLDGINWENIGDFSKNTIPASSNGNAFYPNNHTARYLRVNMTYNSANIGVHIVEFKAYGTLNSTLSNTKFEQNNNQKDTKYTFSINPNPIKKKDKIKLALDLSLKEKVIIHIFNPNGNKILSKVLNLAKGLNEVEFQSEQLSTGLFIIKVEAFGKTKTKKIVIK
ncbi:discoidin domain-containing protein [uncultured Algibacter sp.]|uniref:discoidin domain-containing protein n=1 Tax=uncultured Algibacter sp. TaxID=298659 RepID=UPI003216F246